MRELALSTLNVSLNTETITQDGSLDTSFNPQASDQLHGANGAIQAIARQSDGKILIAGYFTDYNGVEAKHIARLNKNGDLDTSFNVGGTGANGPVFAIAVHKDGKIIMGGSFTEYNGKTANHIAQLTSEGARDPEFIFGSGTNDIVTAIAIQDDGKIIIGGFFTVYRTAIVNRITRLKKNGVRDPNFNAGGTGTNNSINTITFQGEGDNQKLLIAGSFTKFNNAVVSRLTRLNTDGSLDRTFASKGANNSITAMAVQQDGKILIGGLFTKYSGTTVNKIVRLKTNGSIDPSLKVGTGIEGYIFSLAVQNDGKILIGGDFTSYNDLTVNHIARLITNGSLDTTFNQGNLGANGNIYTHAFQSDGKILIGGNFIFYNGNSVGKIARLHDSGGSIDKDFNIGQDAGSSFRVLEESVQKLLMGGYFSAPVSAIAWILTFTSVVFTKITEIDGVISS